MKRLLASAFIFFAASVIFAQNVPPALMVDIDGESRPLEITKVETNVTVLGVLAETSMKMTFFNPNSRQLAGDLYFPLPDGSTVSGYALDVNGVMVDGVVVEKTKARVVFETEMRKGVDPGIVEWVKGNNFKTRVFPIPANGTRTVSVKYVSELLTGQDDPVYHLPLKFQNQVKDFSLRVEVVTAVEKPVVKEGGLANFSFESWKSGFMAEARLSDASVKDDLKIAMPGAAEQKVLVEKYDDDEIYFCIHDTGHEQASQKPQTTPDRIVILWDASASRGKVDHAREIKLIESFLATCRDKKITVEFVPFSNEKDESQIFDIMDNDIKALIQAVNDVVYDGGTQMGTISPPATENPPDYYFLFSDGISNFGKEDPEGFKAPVYAFNADSSANHSFLRYLAMRTGGEYFNLAEIPIDKAVSRIGKPAFSFVSAEYDEKIVEETYPSVPRNVQGSFFLAGRITGNTGTVKLNYGYDGKTTRSGDFTIDAGKAHKGDLLRRLWAQKKLEELIVFPKRNEKEIVAMGKRYGLVTPFTSLIVLETFDQYLEHEIIPPKTLPDFHKRYFEIVEQRSAEAERMQSEKISRVLGMWQNRVSWWEMDFNVPDGFKVYGNAQGKSLGGTGAAFPGSAPDEEVMRDADAIPQSLSESESSLEFDSADKSNMIVGAPIREATAKKMDAPEPKAQAEPGVAMKAWSPDTPYIKKIREAGKGREFGAYMGEKAQFGGSPAFFLDCADFFIKQDEKKLGLRILSNIAELELENAALLRVLGHRLAQLEYLELSAMIFEEVLKIRPEEPQSYRDLALVLGRLGRFERAIELLYQVVIKEWDGRFPEIEVIALVEMNNLITKAEEHNNVVPKVDERFIKPLDMDIRIVMTWDADMTDMDLWVIEPSDEKAYYGYSRTQIGGLVSRDFTRGYGPEEYLLKKALRGNYVVQTNFFGSQAQSLIGAVTLQVDVFTNYGRKNEKRRSTTLRLTGNKETFTVAEMEF